MRMLDTYVGTLHGDGGCDEGVAYWNVAGGALLDCLELIRHVGGGEADFYHEPKIRALARFPLHAHVAGGWYLNFADCDARPYLSGERIARFGERIGDAALTALGRAIEAGHPDIEPADAPEFSRVLNRLFAPVPDAAPPAPEGADVALSDTQITLVRRGAYAAAIKGGHNAENHNHNDVGAFVLYEHGEAGVRKLIREMTLKETGLTLTDRIELREPRPVTGVFMLRAPDTSVACDPDLTRAVEEIPVEDPRMARSFPGSVWRLTLTAPPAASHERTFQIQSEK